MRRAVLLVLLPLLLLSVGFVPDEQMDAEEALRISNSVPELEDVVSNPTVAATARYDAAGDLWRVDLREEASEQTVARLAVDDATREVEDVEVLPAARTVTYPQTTEDEAIRLAAASPEVRAELAEHPPHTTRAEYDEGDGEWTVHFEVEEGGAAGGYPTDDGDRKEIARVGVDDATWQLNYVWTGDQVGWQMARGDYGAYGKQANYWWVWGPLALAFAVAFWRTDRLISLRNFDVLALLGFLVSHGFFRAGESYLAVLLWYVPLLYLLVRCALMGFGVGERVEKTSSLPTWVLFVGAILASALVLGLNLDSRVIDVGYASVAGGDRVLEGTLPYGNMPDDVGTGDTYGPLNYLLYAPFVWLFGWSGVWDSLPAAHAVTAFAFVGAAVAMLAAGYRYAGAKGGAALLFAWAVFPYTLYSTNNNTNDVLVAAVAAVGLAAATSPVVRGASIAAGFAIKLFPIVLAPLWILHDGNRRRAPILEFVLAGLGVVLLSSWVLVLDGDPLGGLQIFYERTVAFQGSRETPWTIFAQVPWLGFLQKPLMALAILFAFALALVPKKRTVRRLAALSAAVIAAFQITFSYWFYPYVTWLEPFVFLALLPATNEKTPLDGASEEPEAGEKEAEKEAVPSGEPAP